MERQNGWGVKGEMDARLRTRLGGVELSGAPGAGPFMHLPRALVGLLGLCPVAEAAPLTIPAGQDGAGLGLRPDQAGRVWSDVGIHLYENSATFALVLGGGLQISPSFEVEIQAPLAVSVGPSASGGRPGNLTLAGRYVDTAGPVRVHAGGALSLPTARMNGWGGAMDGAFPDAFQHVPLWFPYDVVVAFPLHIEIGRAVVGSLDASPQVYFGAYSWPGPLDIASVITPGVGVWLREDVALGLRAPGSTSTPVGTPTTTNSPSSPGSEWTFGSGAS